MHNVISLLVQIWNKFPIKRIPLHDNNHCEGCVNLPDNLNQCQGYNSVVSNHQVHRRSSIKTQTLEDVLTLPNHKGY